MSPERHVVLGVLGVAEDDRVDQGHRVHVRVLQQGIGRADLLLVSHPITRCIEHGKVIPGLELGADVQGIGSVPLAVASSRAWRRAKARLPEAMSSTSLSTWPAWPGSIGAQKQPIRHTVLPRRASVFGQGRQGERQAEQQADALHSEIPVARSCSMRPRSQILSRSVGLVP